MTKYKKFIELLDSSNERGNMHKLNRYITSDYDNVISNYDIGYIPETIDTGPTNIEWLLPSPLINYNGNDMSNYSIWQHDKEVHLNPPMLDEIEPENNEPMQTCNIDMSINCVGDLLDIVNKHDVQPNTQYNIDLATLHEIKPELTSLNNMIGMATIKQSVVDQLLYFIQSLHVGRNVSDFKHTVIYGPPGTGKTEVARIIGQMYSKIGVLKNNIFRKVTRNDLIAGYLGQTAIKTKQVITECLGGVLFIDEAYSLYGSDSNDTYSKECLDILCEALSDHKSELMVIIAGYEEELNNTFFRANQGLNSRFIWRFAMQPYTMNELMEIFNKMVLEQEWTISEDLKLTEKWFLERKDNFTSSGRDIEALITYIKVAHGRRIYGNVNARKKSINMQDINTGYKQFANNKKKKVFKDYGLYV